MNKLTALIGRRLSALDWGRVLKAPPSVLHRCVRYFKVLSQMHGAGEDDAVYAADLGRQVGVSSNVVRKDLWFMGLSSSGVKEGHQVLRLRKLMSPIVSRLSGCSIAIIGGNELASCVLDMLVDDGIRAEVVFSDLPDYTYVYGKRSVMVMPLEHFKYQCFGRVIVVADNKLLERIKEHIDPSSVIVDLVGGVYPEGVVVHRVDVTGEVLAACRDLLKMKASHPGK